MPLKSRLSRYLKLERQVDALESVQRVGDVWGSLAEAYPMLEEMARLRLKMTLVEREVLTRREFDWEPYPGPFFRPSERLFFEYHCNEADDSSDAFLWYHSCQYCTVTKVVGRDEETLYGPNYRVRFDDGFEGEATSDELFQRRFKVSMFREANKDRRWYAGEGCRPAETAKARAFRANFNATGGRR